MQGYVVPSGKDNFNSHKERKFVALCRDSMVIYSVCFVDNSRIWRIIEICREKSFYCVFSNFTREITRLGCPSSVTRGTCTIWRNNEKFDLNGIVGAEGGREPRACLGGTRVINNGGQASPNTRLNLERIWKTRGQRMSRNRHVVHHANYHLTHRRIKKNTRGERARFCCSGGDELSSAVREKQDVPKVNEWCSAQMETRKTRRVCYKEGSKRKQCWDCVCSVSYTEQR